MSDTRWFDQRSRDRVSREEELSAWRATKFRSHLGWPWLLILGVVGLVAIAFFMRNTRRGTEVEALRPAAEAEKLTSFLAASSGKVSERVTLKGLSFKEGKADLAAALDVEPLASVLRKHPTAKVRIEGSTADLSTELQNQALSRSRAEMVRNLLIIQGVDRRNISVVGRGASVPERVDLIVTP